MGQVLHGSTTTDGFRVDGSLGVNRPEVPFKSSMLAAHRDTTRRGGCSLATSVSARSVDLNGRCGLSQHWFWRGYGFTAEESGGLFVGHCAP